MGPMSSECFLEVAEEDRKETQRNGRRRETQPHVAAWKMEEGSGSRRTRLAAGSWTARDLDSLFGPPEGTQPSPQLDVSPGRPTSDSSFQNWKRMNVRCVKLVVICYSRNRKPVPGQAGKSRDVS